MNKEICQKCGDEDEGDLRTLWIDCLYEMNELSIPFTKIPKGKTEFHTLQVCKRCRADFMIAIKDWFHSPIIVDTCDTGIFIREYGKLLQITPEEFENIRISKEADCP